MATESEIAWAAGLFEGEGSFTCSSGNHGGFFKCSMIGSLATVDQDVAERFLKVVDVGTITSSQFTVKNKRVYIWQCSGWQVVRVTKMFAPWLGQRRKEQIEKMFLARHLYEETHPLATKLIKPKETTE